MAHLHRACVCVSARACVPVCVNVCVGGWVGVPVCVNVCGCGCSFGVFGDRVACCVVGIRVWLAFSMGE